jgi:hypothetical protein
LLGSALLIKETVKMRVKLGQIADIRTGYTLREGLDKTSRGKNLLVQMSDFESLNEGMVDRIKTTDIEIRSSDWLLQEGDLLIKARGTDFIPTIIQKMFHGAVFAHPLLRLRVDKKQAVPEFIAWRLSQTNIQVQLLRLTTGTSLQMLKLEHLKSLEIDLPPLCQQLKAQEIVQLMNQEQRILSLLKIKRKQLVCCSIENLCKINK